MKTNRTKPTIGIVTGSLLLILSPIVAFGLHVAGILHAFDALGADGIGDPKRLSRDINVVLYAWVGGAGGSVIGLIILIVSIVLLVRAGRVLPPSNELKNCGTIAN